MPSSPGRTRRVPFGQHGGDLLDQPALHHLLRPARDPLVQHRPRHGQHDVPGIDRALRSRRRAASGERLTGEQRDLDGAGGALSPAAAKSGIETAGPAHQLERLESARSRRPARAARAGSSARLAEQSLRERADIEPGSSHHDRQLAARAARRRSSPRPSRAKWPAL